MRRNSRLVMLLCACAAAMAVVWPNDAYAQRRGRFHPARRVMVVSAGYHYGPGYYWPAYAPYFWGWYPYGAPLGYYPPYYDYRDYLSSARVQVTPKDAQVYVDGYFAGTVDDFDGMLQRLRVEPGEHEIQLYREGYRTISEKILFRPGETYRIRYAMEPLPAGTEAEPPPHPAAGATTGQPFPGRDYPERGRRPAPPAPGYPPNAPPGDVPLANEPGSTFGTLSIRVQPADAAITVDGERWEGPGGGSRLIIQLPEGSHRVEIHKDGYKEFSRTVDVRRGEVSTLNVSLVSEDRP